MSVVGAHHQRHLLAALAHPCDRGDDIRDVRVRRPHQRAVLPGAELHDVLRVVGLAQPQRMQGVRARGVERGAEPAGGLPVAASVVGDVEVLRPVDRLEPRPVRPAAVQQQTVSVRILHVGGARGGVEPVRRPAVLAEPLAHGGPAQGASRRASKPLAKGRRPYRNRNETVAFVERDHVAVQSMGGGKAARGERRRVHPGRGRKDRAVIGVPARPRCEPMQIRSEFVGHEIAAQPVDHDEDGAALNGHGSPTRDARLLKARYSRRILRSLVHDGAPADDPRLFRSKTGRPDERTRRRPGAQKYRDNVSCR